MKRHLLARVLAGHLEPDEPVDLPDGTVVELTLEVPGPAPKSRPRVTFRPRKIGVRQPLTRESIYEDVG
jgi:hypothetical protein